MTSVIYVCWLAGIAAQILGAAWIAWRARCWWSFGALLADAAKSLYLLLVPSQDYASSWMALRWVHWATVAVLALQSVWTMAKMWPQRRDLFWFACIAIGGASGITAAIQLRLFRLAGLIGSWIMAGRAVIVASLAFVFYSRSLMRRLAIRGKMSANAEIFASGLAAMLTMEVLGTSIATAARGNLSGQVAYYVVGIGQISLTIAPAAALWSWRRLSRAGDDAVLPPRDPGAEKRWEAIASVIRRQKDRARRRAAGAS